MTITVHSPNGELVGSVSETEPNAIPAKVGELRAAQKEWERIGIEGRSRWLRRYRNWLQDNQDRLSKLVQAETGKAWPDATIEVPYAVEVLNYYCDHASVFLGDARRSPASLLTSHKRQWRVLRPHPLVVVIAPWNFPLAIAMMDALPALVAGAAVIVKPSEVAPLATHTAIAGWHEIGAPGVFACATGGPDIGTALVDEADFVAFTGSTRTGRAIARRAGERMVPFSLELGGKDPMLVLEDADIELAARGAVFGAMFNSGQACVAVERVYVCDAVYEEFVDAVLDEVRKLRQGVAAADYSIDVGAMATAAQTDIVAAHVDDALQRGARVLAGGRRTAPRFFEPTVLLDVDHSMRCMTEETFGPLLPIMKVHDSDEAVRLANESSFGLSASVWTRDRARGRMLARQLDVGAVNVNDVAINVAALSVPHSGWKESGFGARNGGAYGIRKYCRAQAITENRIDVPQPQWYPYSDLKGALITRLVGVSTARDPLRMIRNLLGNSSIPL